jgi:peptidyl-prolyl cis-trans isomerase A (cyclophilin A)
VATVAIFASVLAYAQDSPAPPPAVVAAPATVNVVLTTTLGDIRVALETERAPVTAQNFLRYVDQKRFDGTAIYRAVKIGDDSQYGLVQGGLQGDRKRSLPPIAHESPATTGVSHVSGAISMAREAPGTATADFFFVIGDLVALDGAPGGDPGYAAFGRVTEGLELLRSVLDLPRAATAANEAMKGQMLAEPIRILTVRRAE